MKTLLLFVTCLLILVSCNETSSTSSPESASMEHFPDFDFQGHRGARGLLPENTIPSLIKALEFGVTTLEFDVVVSADSLIVLSHEPWFHHEISSWPDGRAVTLEESITLNMFQMTYYEIKSFDVGIRGHARFPDQQPMAVSKPLLKDAIKAVEAHILEHNMTPVWYNIETKSQPDGYNIFVPEPSVFVEILYAELKELGILDRTVIQSFDVNTLKEMRALDARVPLALLVENTFSIEHNLDLLGFIPEIYSPNFRLLDAAQVELAHSKGMKVIPWTINEISDMHAILELGVDGIITDYPNRFREIKD